MFSLLCIVSKESEFHFRHHATSSFDTSMDQPQLYALFDLVLALAGDMGIALSLALTRAFVKGNLSFVLGDSARTDEVKPIPPKS